jgi:hypothetical protein
MGKKVGSAGIPRDQPEYGLVQATSGIVGTQDVGEEPAEPSSAPDDADEP